MEENTAEEMTTVKTIEGGIEINGCQISANTKGLRAIYSVDSEIAGKEVIASGMIYSLGDYSTEADMKVESTHDYVRYYKSSEKGICSYVHSESDKAISYAMTMKFATESSLEYTAKWRVRAYAQLSDSTYVYSDCIEYTIYEVADKLYQGSMMNNETAHEYLYTSILSVVNRDYVLKQYDINNTIVEG